MKCLGSVRNSFAFTYELKYMRYTTSTGTTTITTSTNSNTNYDVYNILCTYVDLSKMASVSFNL